MNRCLFINVVKMILIELDEFLVFHENFYCEKQVKVG